MKVGFVVPEVIDGRFNPWEDSLEWESYLDFYSLALQKRGHTCVKYVPSIGVSKTTVYRHKFGHSVKRVPVFNRLMAPRSLFKTRKYEFGYTTSFHSLLAPAFVMNLFKEAERDRIQVLHHASYYTTFFVPSFMTNWALPTVVQFTGGSLPRATFGRLAWKLALFLGFKSSRAVLVGDYPSEVAVLDSFGLHSSLRRFDAPIIDQEVFHEVDKRQAQRGLGFDPGKKNLLSVTFIPHRHTHHVAKDPFLLVDLFEQVAKEDDGRAALYFVGWGPGEQELRDYIQEKRLDSRAKVLGKVEHASLPAYYSASDLVLIPFRLDKLNQGSATIEGFACGRPAAAFKLHDSDSTEQTGGFLIDDSSPRGASTLVRRLDDDYLTEKGREAKAFSEQFTMPHAGARLEEIYSAVIGEAGKARLTCGQPG